MFLINPTRRQLDRDAIKEDMKRQQLQVGFAIDLNKFFSKILRDLNNSYTQLSIVPDQIQYFDKLERLLKKNQLKVAEVFSGILRDNKIKHVRFFERKAPKLNIEQEEEDSLEIGIAIALAEWIDQESVNQTELILETNQKEISNAIDDAKDKLIEQGKPISNKAIAALAITRLKSVFGSRSNLIAHQNVLATSQEAKLEEAQAINQSNGVIEGVAVAGLVKKTWNAILDSKTRPAHATADFTYNENPILLIEPFIVAGEQLKYPGDPNGSAGNIMNCRCVMQTFAVTYSASQGIAV